MNGYYDYKDIIPKQFWAMQYILMPEFFSEVKSHRYFIFEWNSYVTNCVTPDKNAFHFPNYNHLLTDIMKLEEGPFDLYIGSSSVLSIKNVDDIPVDIYMSPREKRFPVPKYIWMVITTESGKAATFLILHDIHASEEEVKNATLCESKCTQMKWIENLLKEDTYRNASNGYVWCCDFESFANNIPEMPALNASFDILI